jgi:2-hydroxy-6-oxonona-2,4-dienedioate hydrolase
MNGPARQMEEYMDDVASPTYRSIWGDLRGVSFTQRWIDAGGVRTRLLESGDPGASPLIFLHGTGGHSEAFVRNLGPHGERYWTIAMDMLGHGWTAHPGRDLEIPDYVDHVMAMMDELGISRAAFSGESLGGWVATRLAIEHPERVSALVLNTAGGTRADPKVMETIRTLSTKAVEDPSWPFVKARLEWLMADPSRVNNDLVAARQAIYAQDGMAVAMAHTLALQDMEVRQRNLLRDEDLARVSVPTLVLWTSHDPTAPAAEGERIAGVIPGAEYVLMQDCGHWPQFENPTEFNCLHLDFLDRVVP